jgi:hypothetical protein
MSTAQKTDPEFETICKEMGWDLAEATELFAKAREEEKRWQHYYANIDPRPGQLQIDWFLNFYELTEAEGEAYACNVRAICAGTSAAVADEQLYAAWGIRPDEKDSFLSARVRKQPVPRPWQIYQAALGNAA